MTHKISVLRVSIAALVWKKFQVPFMWSWVPETTLLSSYPGWELSAHFVGKFSQPFTLGLQTHLMG